MSPDLSIIVPLYNEEESVAPLHAALVAALQPMRRPFEILLVDDGSRDGTAARCLALSGPRSSVRLLQLRRNFGQTAAMAAGIEHAQGRILVTMDGDLQNDPADIPRLVAAIDEGYDLVVGWRERRQDKYASRVLPSKIANWLIGKVTGVPIKDNGCSLKAYQAAFIKQIPLYGEMHRFIPAMSSFGGARIKELSVRHHPRQFGASKYGLTRIYKVLLDLLAIKTLLLFRRRPLAWFGAAAGLSTGVACATLIYTLWLIVVAGETSVALVGCGILLGSLALFLTFLGLLNHLIYQSRAPSLEAFRLLAARGQVSAVDPLGRRMQ